MKGIILPYYASSAGMTDGSADAIINVAKKYPNVPITVIVFSGNFTLGAGLSGLTDRTAIHYYIDNFQKYGIKVIMYLETTNNTPTIETFKSAVDIMMVFYPSIDGFFLDEYANIGNGTAKPLSWYTEACQYIRNLGEKLIVGNCGGWTTSTWYTQYPNAPDIMLIYESPSLPDVSSCANAYGSPTRNGIIPYNITSASVSDSLFNSYVNAVDWVYFNSRSDWVGVSSWIDRQCQLLSEVNNPSLNITLSNGNRTRLDVTQSISSDTQTRLKTTAGYKIGGKTIAKNDLKSGNIRIKTSAGINSIKKL